MYPCIYQGDTGTGGDPIFGLYLSSAGSTYTFTNREFLSRSASGAHTALPHGLHFPGHPTLDGTWSVRVRGRVVSACPKISLHP